MKRIIVVMIMSLCIIIPHYAFAGPFGLSMGMTRDQFGDTLQAEKNNTYTTTTVPKAHGSFEKYALLIDSKLGLATIKAFSGPIPTSVYGSELKSKFLDLENQLKSVYGENKRYDFLRFRSIWNEPKDWMMGLLKKERTLAAYWSKDHNSNLKDDIVGISLTVDAYSTEGGLIVLEYQFDNAKEAIDNLKKREAGSL